MIVTITFYLKFTSNNMNYSCEASGAGIDKSNATLPQKFFFNIHIMIVMQQVTVILFILVKSHNEHEKELTKRNSLILQRSESMAAKDEHLIKRPSRAGYKAPALGDK